MSYKWNSTVCEIFGVHVIACISSLFPLTNEVMELLGFIMVVFYLYKELSIAFLNDQKI